MDPEIEQHQNSRIERMRYASMVYSERSFQKINTKRAWSAKAKKSTGNKSVKEKTKNKLTSSTNASEECDLYFANCFTGPADYQSNLDLTGKD